MAYEVLARKWRPRQFDDVVGQEHVTRTLRNAIASGRLAHAYLFVGPRGIGKTSLARIFAEALNCDEGPTDKPCGTCHSCREIATGSNLDVLEIDGASNNKVEEVRDLRENVKFLPARSRFKIYIIDEVHMLSIAAFNALLKTLEEPPPHVKFIFATTEPQKILPTILSRCQRFDLRRITVADIVGRLMVIAEAEGITADAEALAAVGRAAEGSLRDAVSALDQLRAFKGDTIEADDVLSVFGLVSQQTLVNLATAILDGDIRAIIDVVHELDAGGKDMQRLLVELLDHFRNVLVMHYAPDGMTDGDLLEAQLDAVREQAARCDPERLLRITDLLVEAEPRLRYALSRRTLLETSLIRCARAAVTVSIDQILARLDALGVPPPEADAAATAATASPTASPTAVAVEDKKKTAVTEPPREVTDPLERLQAGWHDLIEAVSVKAPMAKTALLDTRPLAVSDETVTLGLDPEFADDLSRLQHQRTQRALQRVLGDTLGRSVSIDLRLMTESERAAMGPRLRSDTSPTDASPTDTDDDTDDDTEPAGETPAASPASPPPEGSRASTAAWRDDPLVRSTLEAFHGTIVEVRE